MMTRTVFGIVRTQDEAKDLVTELEHGGFARAEISVLVSDEAKQQATRLDLQSYPFEHAQTETHSPDGAAIGATAGTAIGGALGLLAGLGALAIPGLGFFLAAGPIVGLLSGLGVGAAVGGLAGVLVGLGIPEHHARKYELLVQDGNVLLAVHCDSAMDQQRALQVLTTAGATNSVSSVASGPTEPKKQPFSASLR